MGRPRDDKASKGQTHGTHTPVSGIPGHLCYAGTWVCSHESEEQRSSTKSTKVTNNNDTAGSVPLLNFRGSRPQYFPKRVFLNEEIFSTKPVPFKHSKCI